MILQTLMEKHYDLNFLREYYGEDLDAMKPLLQLYIEETPKEIHNIEKSLSGNDASGAKAATHKVKTNVTMMGIRNTSAFIDAMHKHKADASVSEEVIQLFNPFKAAVLSAVDQLQKDFFG